MNCTLHSYRRKVRVRSPVEAKSFVITVEAKSFVITVEAKSIVITVEAKSFVITVEAKSFVITVDAKSFVITVEAKSFVITVETKSFVITAILTVSYCYINLRDFFKLNKKLFILNKIYTVTFDVLYVVGVH
jgi:hypothetical protein